MPASSPDLNAARANGSRTYFTGKPCKYWHVAERLTSNSTCIECTRIITRKCNEKPERKRKVRDWIAKNKDRLKSVQAEYRSKNLDRKRVTNADWAIRNPEKVVESRRKYAITNPDKVRKSAEATRKKNRAKLNAKWAQRNALKINATPKWACTEKIREFYVTAHALGMLTGEWYHVDHIVPLQSEIVCGLHVQTNLQVITQSENTAKGNRYWPDMP